ncbi:GPW/gp25 family protein [bacterium]|nr:GPW/gp25 family protein [bacterium]
MIFAPTFPLSFDDTNGFQNVQDLNELAKFHLRNLLMTNKGEKISDPNYGVGIRKFLFSLDSMDVEEDVRSEIESQVENYLTYLTIISINVSVDEQEMNVQLRFKLTEDSETQIMNLEISTLSSGTPTTIY